VSLKSWSFPPLPAIFLEVAVALQVRYMRAVAGFLPAF